MNTTKLFFLLPLVVAVFLSGPDAGAEPRVKLTPIYPKLEVERPISLIVPPDGTNRRFLVEQTGKIKILPADESASEAVVFADFDGTMKVEKDFEEGLLGLAFHPDFKSNHKLYVYYTQQGPKRSVVSEFLAKGDAIDMESERILLEIQQPEWNHNSGNLLFGPDDGYLYIAVGDGGLRDGVHLLAQRLQSWSGKVLRIDVNTKAAGREYGIPADNPFIDVPHACPEIYALGLRNPWGIAIDAETGDFWLADVGQDLWEEVNLIEKGGNYGWNYREGMHEFTSLTNLMAALKRKAPKTPRGLVDPVHEYSRADGLSITGGFVYRGDKVPSLKGHYVFGDWKLGNLWALEYDSGSQSVKANHHFEKPADPKNPTVQPTGFYPDENGEVIVLGWRGKLFRIESE